MPPMPSRTMTLSAVMRAAMLSSRRRSAFKRAAWQQQWRPLSSRNCHPSRHRGDPLAWAQIRRAQARQSKKRKEASAPESML